MIPAKVCYANKFIPTPHLSCRSVPLNKSGNRERQEKTNFSRPSFQDDFTHKNRYVAAKRTKKIRSEEHTSELQSQSNLVCRLLLEKKKKQTKNIIKLKRVKNYRSECPQTRTDRDGLVLERCNNVLGRKVINSS